MLLGQLHQVLKGEDGIFLFRQRVAQTDLVFGIVEDFERPGVARQPDFLVLGLVERMRLGIAARDVAKVFLFGQPGFESVEHFL